jgi:hypothetical protein
MSERIRRAHDYLAELQAASVEHLHGDLLTHLEGTRALLAQWSASETVQLAGLCHAAYGTDGFPPALLELSQRAQLREVIGEPAEALVYFYAACDRGHLYPRLGGSAPPTYRDRFTHGELVPEPQMLRDFVELTFANELEIARGSRDFRDANYDAYEELFERCRSLATTQAYATFRETFPLSRPLGLQLRSLFRRLARLGTRI